MIEVTLSGPQTVASGPYALGGGGDGYHYAMLIVGGLPPGEYTLTATRNGSEVATERLPRGG